MSKKYILTIFFMTLIIGMAIFIVSDNTGKEKVKNESILIKNEKDTNNNDNNKEGKKQLGPKEIKLVRNSNKSEKVNDNVKTTEVSSSLQKFTIYFDCNGGVSEIESKEVIYKEEYGYLPVPKKEGYTFEGWYIDKEFSKKIESTSVEVIKGNHTLYANYTINRYLITYDFNYLENNLYKNLTDKSSWSTSNIDILMDDELFLNENVYKITPSLEDYTIKYNEKVKLEEGKTYTLSVYIKTNEDRNLLIGFQDELINVKTNSSWQRFTKTFNASSSNYSNFIFSLDDNIIWNNDDFIEIYGLTLSEENLNKREDEKNYNETLGELDAPIRDGYTFDGWYTDFTFKEEVSQDTIVSSDKVYYAKWNSKLYKLEIDLNGGIYDKSKSNTIFTQGYKTIMILNKPKASYKITYDLNGTNAVNNKKEDIINRSFKGFIDDDNNLYDSDIYVFNKDSKLKANFDESVNVTLDSISKSDYTCFWNTKKDGSGNKYDINSNITINSDITLYAYCKRNIKFIRPIKSGCITSEYGYRIHPIYGYNKFHSGIDMSGNDKNIYPILDGKVAKTGSNSSMGNYIIIHHTMNGKNYTSAYYHLEAKYSSAGDLVTQDTLIGKMGQTGAATGVHLHLTMYEGHLYNESSKMVNPRDYINFPSSIYSYWQDRGM